MTALVVGLGCLGLHVAVTLVWLRMSGRLSPVARHTVSALVTHLVGVSLAALALGPFAYWPAVALNSFGVVVWLFLFSAVYKSVSLRILTELDRTPSCSIPIDVITQRFVQPEFANRVQVLLKMDCVEETERQFQLTAKGNIVARRIEIVRRVSGIEGGGLYSEHSSDSHKEAREPVTPPVA